MNERGQIERLNEKNCDLCVKRFSEDLTGVRFEKEVAELPLISGFGGEFIRQIPRGLFLALLVGYPRVVSHVFLLPEFCRLRPHGSYLGELV